MAVAVPGPSCSKYQLPPSSERMDFDRVAHRVSCGLSDVWHCNGWLSPSEESDLVACIDAQPSHLWTRLKDRKLMHLGGSPAGALGTGIEAEPLPPWAQAVCKELVRVGVFPAAAPPNHILLNEYEPGQGIDPHKDGVLYMPHVAVISLHSHTTLQFLADTAERSPVASLLLPPRGLLVFGGDAYKLCLHTTTKQKEDDLLRPGLVRLATVSAKKVECDGGGTDCDCESLSAQSVHTGAYERDGNDGRFMPRDRRLSLTVRRLRQWWEKWE